MASEYRARDLFLDLGLMASAGRIQHAVSLNKTVKGGKQRILFVVNSDDFMKPEEFLPGIDDFCSVLTKGFNSYLGLGNDASKILSFNWTYSSMIEEDLAERVVNEWAVIYVLKFGEEEHTRKKQEAGQFLARRYTRSPRLLVVLENSLDMHPLKYTNSGTLHEIHFTVNKQNRRSNTDAKAFSEMLRPFLSALRILVYNTPCCRPQTVQAILKRAGEASLKGVRDFVAENVLNSMGLMYTFGLNYFQALGSFEDSFDTMAGSGVPDFTSNHGYNNATFPGLK